MGRKKLERSAKNHTKTINDHLRKMDRYGPSDTSAQNTIRHSIKQLKKVLIKSGSARKQRAFWEKF